MAASKNYSGRALLLYATQAAAPAAAATASDYTLVGNVTDVSISRSRNTLDTSNKDDGDETSLISGRRSNTVSGSANWDHTSNAGQLMFTTALNAANGTIYFLVTSTATGEPEFHGSGVVTQADLSFPDEGISTLAFSVAVNGALTEVSGTTT